MELIQIQALLRVYGETMPKASVTLRAQKYAWPWVPACQAASCLAASKYICFSALSRNVPPTTQLVTCAAPKGVASLYRILIRGFFNVAEVSR